jgi:GAF domain-containing protein
MLIFKKISNFADLIIATLMTKEEKYKELQAQITSLIEGETDTVSVMANVVAAIHEAMGFFWTGFYIEKGGMLCLGPFQGPVACYRIKHGKGVCGTAYERRATVVVPDVEEFPGHIACSSLSRSEIVVPVFKSSEISENSENSENPNPEILAVLDIDSRELGTFDDTDRQYLESIMAIVAPHLC